MGSYNDVYEGRKITYLSVSLISCINGGHYEHIQRGADGGMRRQRRISGDISVFVLRDGARGEEGSHMAGIYQPMAAAVIECELKVKPQTAERESRGPRPRVYHRAVHHLP